MTTTTARLTFTSLELEISKAGYVLSGVTGKYVVKQIKKNAFEQKFKTLSDVHKWLTFEIPTEDIIVEPVPVEQVVEDVTPVTTEKQPHHKHWLHVTYIADDLMGMKGAIEALKLHNDAYSLSAPEVRCIASEYLISNGVGSAITPPATDFEHWLPALQKMIRTVDANRNDGVAAISNYHKHDGCIDTKQGLSKQDAIIGIMQQLSAIGGFLDGYIRDKDIGYPSYIRRDDIPEKMTVHVGNVVIVAPVNKYSSTNNLLIAKSNYSISLTLKEYYRKSLKLNGIIEPLIVPIIAKHVDACCSVIWNKDIFDIEVIGGKFDLVSEILNGNPSTWYWAKRRFYIQHLSTPSGTKILADKHIDDAIDPLLSIPDLLRVGIKADRLYWSDRTGYERLVTRELSVKDNDGKWCDLMQLLGYIRK